MPTNTETMWMVAPLANFDGDTLLAKWREARKWARKHESLRAL